MTFPSVFPIWWVTLTASITGVAGFGVLFAFRKPFKLEPLEIVRLALVTGVSLFAWRFAGNVPALNNDPVPPFSPNDLLCPVVTFVALELYTAFRPPTDLPRWSRVRAALVLVSLVVNVLTI